MLTPPPNPQTPPFFFSHLPGELRNMIYDYLIGGCEEIIEYSRRVPLLRVYDESEADYEISRVTDAEESERNLCPRSKIPVYRKDHQEFGLMLVCKQFYSELRSLVYARKQFHLDYFYNDVRIVEDRFRPSFWSLLRRISARSAPYEYSNYSMTEFDDLIRPLVSQFKTVTFCSFSNKIPLDTLAARLKEESSHQGLVEAWKRIASKDVWRTYETYRLVFADEKGSTAQLYVYDGVTMGKETRTKRWEDPASTQIRLNLVDQDNKMMKAVLKGSWVNREDEKPKQDMSISEWPKI